MRILSSRFLQRSRAITYLFRGLHAPSRAVGASPATFFGRTRREFRRGACARQNSNGLVEKLRDYELSGKKLRLWRRFVAVETKVSVPTKAVHNRKLASSRRCFTSSLCVNSWCANELAALNYDQRDNRVGDGWGGNF